MSTALACFLPEASDFIVPTQDQCYDLSQPLHCHTFINGLQALARELGVWIGVGIHELPTAAKDGEQLVKEAEAERKVFNSFVAIQPTGEVAETYRKVSSRVINGAYQRDE
ncbi:hypothetical protein QFC22_004711 [Naganishia vaughanmartiniae]|uniref:Uncharacterized protein n=1 Tax=Naganishia vaughanmartiniae TaxID=1424756 RepID=A0ACC2WZK8_9TREE|nr:hypothetical protein QFC22_004711 [Naganishia vaughanmartiniae]